MEGGFFLISKDFAEERQPATSLPHESLILIQHKTQKSYHLIQGLTENKEALLLIPAKGQMMEGLLAAP